MSWPWSQLGLPGPSGLSEIRRAYAEKLKTTHPEDDPEGFQELHSAYQVASRMARHRKPEDFGFDELLRESGERPRRIREAGPDWDYARLFAEGEAEREEYRRRRSEERRRQRRNMILTVVSAAVLITAMCWAWLRSGRDLTRAGDPRERVCRYIEEDMGVKVGALYNLSGAYATDAYGNVFYLEEDPENRRFLAGPDGERDMENGRSGYATNLPEMMMLWALADFAAERDIHDVDTLDRDLGLERWETGGAFVLTLPDDRLEEIIAELGALLEDLSREAWYQARPPVCEVALCSGQLVLARLRVN